MSAKETSITTVYKSTRDVPSKSMNASLNLSNITPLEYFEEVEENATKTSIKDGFVKVVDFIFYGEKINGTTFSELKDDIKLKIINIALKIDSKIDKMYPKEVMHRSRFPLKELQMSPLTAWLVGLTDKQEDWFKEFL